MTDLPPIPDGFTLDAPKGLPPMPDGFVADQPQPSSSMQSMAIDFQNQGSAAGQRTTPNIGAQSKNLISADTYESDTGDVMFKDPASGQVVPTDKNKHVVLRDPADNRVKVYGRTADTNEGVLSSAGRVLMTGMGSAAPTARPVIPLPGKAASPSIDTLKGAATAGYESPVVAGVEVKPHAVTQLGDTITASLNKAGIDENLAPKTFGVLGKIAEAPDGAVVTGQNLESLRRTLGKAASLPDPVERLAARTAIDHLDDFFANVNRADVLAGDPEKAAEILATARANYSAAMRAEQIDKKMVRAELRAAAANSGQNVANTIRQRIADILLSPSQRRGFSDAELSAMERIVRGTRTQNALRFAGNLLGGGGGLGAVASAAVGGVATGGPGAVAPVIGFALKKLSNTLSLRQIDQLSELVRSRAPAGQAVTPPLKNWATAVQAFEQTRTPRSIAMVTIAARNLSNNLKDMGITIAPGDLLKSIQGPVRAPADEEQQ